MSENEQETVVDPTVVDLPRLEVVGPENQHAICGRCYPEFGGPYPVMTTACGRIYDRRVDYRVQVHGIDAEDRPHCIECEAIFISGDDFECPDCNANGHAPVVEGEVTG